MSNIDKEIKKAKEKHNAILNAINVDKVTFEDLEKKNKEVNSNIAKLEEEKNKLTKEVSILSSSIKSNKDILLSKTQKFQKEIENATDELSTIKNTILENQKIVSEIEKKAKNSEVKLFNITKKIITEKEKRDSEKEIYSGVIDELNNKINLIKESIIVEQSKKEALEKEISDKEVDVSSIVKKIDERNILLNNINNEIEEKSIKNIELKNNIVEMSSEIDKVKKEKEEISLSLETLKKEYDLIVSQKIQLVEQKKELQMAQDFIKEKYKKAGLPFKEIEF